MASTDNVGVVGVDIGANVCRLAHMLPEKKMPTILRNTLSNEGTPSLVSYPAGGAQRLYGEAALGKDLSRPQETVSTLKAALCANSSTDLEPIRRTGTDIVADPTSGGVVINQDGGEKKYAPSQVLAFLLRHLVTFSPEKPSRVCMVAPPSAPFNYIVGLQDAAAIGKVEDSATTVQIVDEADALVAYMHHQQYADLPVDADTASPVVIVCVGDLFTTAVVATMSRPVCTIQAVVSEPFGTSAVDAALSDKVFDAIIAKHATDMRSHPKSYNKTLREVKKAKVMLSTTERASVQLECLKGDIDFSTTLTSADLEQATATYAEKLKALAARTLSGAGLESGATRVEVVGNGWRSPTVALALKKALGVERLGLSLDSNMALAEGAAIVGVMTAFPKQTTGTEEEPTETEKKQESAPSSPASTASPADLHRASIVRGDGVPVAVAAPVIAKEDDTYTKRLAEQVAAEEALFAADEVERLRVRALNEFESALFGTKDIVSAACASDAAAATALNAYLGTEEQWLYDAQDGLVEGLDAGIIEARTAGLQQKLATDFPVVAAYREAEAAKQRAKDEELERLAKENQGEKELKSDPQRLRAAQERREQGATLFKQEHFEEAQTRFVQALSILGQLYDNTGENKAKKDEISLSCHLNIASCSVKLGKWKIAESNCTKALDLKPDHPKALFRRGQANHQLKEFAKAQADLEKASSLTNGDAGVEAELAAVKQAVASQAAKEKKMFSKMFA